jgi:hypothetical protein
MGVVTARTITKHTVRTDQGSSPERQKPGITRELTITERERLVTEMTEPLPDEAVPDEGIEIIVEPADESYPNE